MQKSETVKVKTGCGHLYVTIFESENKIFISSGKTGGCQFTNLESLARIITLYLENGGNLKDVSSQLKGLRCPSPNVASRDNVLSCADGVAKGINIYFASKEIKSA